MWRRPTVQALSSLCHPITIAKPCRLLSIGRGAGSGGGKGPHTSGLRPSARENAHEGPEKTLKDMKPGEVWHGHYKILYKIAVPRDQIQVKYARSSGPGGQNVNKVETQVELRFNVDQAAWLPSAVKRQLKKQLEHKINKAGELVLSSEKTRYRERNLEDAFNRLQEWVDDACTINLPRPPTKPPESANRKRLQAKKMRSDIKKKRTNSDS